MVGDDVVLSVTVAKKGKVSGTVNGVGVAQNGIQYGGNYDTV